MTQIRGVDICVHWSVLFIAGIMLVGSLWKPVVTLVGLGSYLGVLMIHECGHVIAAQRKASRVLCIELYPVWGVTRFHAPCYQIDAAVIAWGGVLAQAVVAAPLITWVVIFGYSRSEAANAALALLGFFSAFVAAFNLIPVHPLDGATAWGLFPALIRNARTLRKQKKRLDLALRCRIEEVFSRDPRK